MVKATLMLLPQTTVLLVRNTCLFGATFISSEGELRTGKDLVSDGVKDGPEMGPGLELCFLCWCVTHR